MNGLRLGESNHQILFDIGMKAAGDRTSICHANQDFLDIFGQAGGQYNIDVAADFGDSAWIRCHVLGGFSGHFGDFEPFCLCINTQGGDDASGQTQRTQIGGREGRSHSFVIGGCIGENFRPALQMNVATA